MHFSPSLIFAGKARSLLLKWIIIKDTTWTCSENFRQKFKWLIAANTIAYYDTDTITSVGRSLSKWSTFQVLHSTVGS
jgi:hypothetical protein